MTKKWNLQDIRPAEPRKPRAPQMETRLEENQPMRDREHIPSIIIEDGRNKGSKRLLISVILFIVIVGSALGLSAVLGKTELTIYPINKQPNVSAEFSAYPDKRDGALSYEIMTIEATGESQVKASGQVQVEQQTKGMIEIIKTSTGAERLIKNTRFQTSDGLVFRIQESVVVPGAVKSSDGSMLPGTIQAEVFADEAGDKYNLAGGSTFTIPGFKESGLDDLFKSITARNPQAFTGGYSGPQFQIDEKELGIERQKLQQKLRDELFAQIDTKKPADFVTFNDSVAITYSQLPAVEYGNDLVTIKEQAILQIPMFNKTDLGSFLAKETIATYDKGKVRIDDPGVLTFKYVSATTSASIIANEPSLRFKLTGKPLLIWEYDAEGLASNLAGLPKTALNNAIDAYPGISEARVRITPFWKRNFPEKAEEIIIVEEIQKTE